MDINTLNLVLRELGLTYIANSEGDSEFLAGLYFAIERVEYLLTIAKESTTTYE